LNAPVRASVVRVLLALILVPVVNVAVVAQPIEAFEDVYELYLDAEEWINEVLDVSLEIQSALNVSGGEPVDINDLGPSMRVKAASLQSAGQRMAGRLLEAANFLTTELRATRSPQTRALMFAIIAESEAVASQRDLLNQVYEGVTKAEFRALRRDAMLFEQVSRLWMENHW